MFQMQISVLWLQFPLMCPPSRCTKSPLYLYLLVYQEPRPNSNPLLSTQSLPWSTIWPQWSQYDAQYDHTKSSYTYTHQSCLVLKLLLWCFFLSAFTFNTSNNKHFVARTSKHFCYELLILSPVFRPKSTCASQAANSTENWPISIIFNYHLVSIQFPLSLAPVLTF